MSKLAASLHAFCLIGITLLLSACAQTPRPKLPAPILLAERHNMTGVAAEAKLDFIDAESEFLEAYRLFSSVENYNGMVATLINSARLYRRQGDSEMTENVLSQAVKLIPHTPELEAEVCFENSKLALMKENNDTAILWAERAVKTATEVDRARMFNLAAGIYLRQGALKKTKELAATALKSSRSVSDRREEANALRLIGEVAFVEKRNMDSIQLYESALAIDKELAIADRVAADLMALSFAAEAMGNSQKAIEYQQRVVNVAIGERNIKAATVNLDRLISLYEHSGNSNSAEKARKLKNSLQ